MQHHNIYRTEPSYSGKKDRQSAEECPAAPHLQTGLYREGKTLQCQSGTLGSNTTQHYLASDPVATHQWTVQHIHCGFLA